MKMFAPLSLILLALSMCPVLSAQEGSRDAEAVLNRCGKPLKGDETVLDNSGGHRMLRYERGTLNFVRVGNAGWRFVDGEHGQKKGIDAAGMSTFMPCLPKALADSASPEPIQTINSVQRMTTSLKESIKQVILYTVVGLVLLGLVFFLMSKRKSEGGYND